MKTIKSAPAVTASKTYHATGHAAHAASTTHHALESTHVHAAGATRTTHHALESAHVHAAGAAHAAHAAHAATHAAHAHAAASHVHVLGGLLIIVLVNPQGEVGRDVAVLDARLQQTRPVLALLGALQVEADVTGPGVPLGAL